VALREGWRERFFEDFEVGNVYDVSPLAQTLHQELSRGIPSRRIGAKPNFVPSTDSQDEPGPYLPSCLDSRVMRDPLSARKRASKRYPGMHRTAQGVNIST
jgi:hypothetical protein